MAANKAVLESVMCFIVITVVLHLLYLKGNNVYNFRCIGRVEAPTSMLDTWSQKS
jgi:hypothetical protein